MKQLERFQTGVPGLDAVLKGGLVAGASYIVQGRPGSGKTLLANQIAYHHAATGGRVLIATLLSESHERLLQLLSTLSYFDAARVGSEISYVSAFDTLESEGLDGVVTLIRREIVRQKATLLVIDGLLNARSMAETALDTKKFIAELQGHAAFAGCTVVFLTSARLEESSPEHTMVDGVLELCEELVGVRAVRRLHVKKSRGTAALAGLHSMAIDGTGVSIHPRLETLHPTPSIADVPSETRLSTGSADLDRITGGGLVATSSTLVVGPSGCGKTSLGLAFLGEASLKEPALHLGFFENPARLVHKGAALGLDLDGLRRAGVLDFAWTPPAEEILDAIAHRMLENVARRGVKRLVIDSIGGLARSGVDPIRLLPFFATVFNELRARGVTVLATWETTDLAGTAPKASAPDVASLMDGLFVMRFAEEASELQRTLTVVKLRDSHYDPAVHTVVLSGHGLAFPAAAAGGGAGPQRFGA